METNEKKEMKITAIIAELFERNILPAAPSGYEKLSGGTVSELYLLNVNDSKYVLKLNDPAVTEPEALFLDTYKKIELLPELLFSDPSHNYILYSYIAGSTAYEGAGKKEVLKALVENLINHYQTVSPESGFGWADSPSASWQDFLRNEVSYAQKSIGSSLDSADHQLIAELVGKIDLSAEPYLLHGDCGFHNFIFNEKELVGVIDPAPVFGDPVYDLVYAFCSSPTDLTKETFDFAINYMKVERKTELSLIYESLLIGLYLRIALCSKHHPKDLPYYLAAWSEWVEIAGKR